MDIQFKIDIKPISINAAFQGRRFKTQNCKDYEKELWIQLPKRATIKGEVEVWYDFFLVNYKMTDISNLVKVTEDILVKKGYFEDDRKVVEMHLRKIKWHKNSLTVKITKYHIL
jgi:Holliday junction resolvase RusA-like endonuclease